LHGSVPVKSNLILMLGLVLWAWGIFNILSNGEFVERLLVYVGIFILITMSRKKQPFPQVRALSLDYLFVLTLGFLLLATILHSAVSGIAPAILTWISSKIDLREYPIISTLIEPTIMILRFEFYFYCAVMLVALGRAKDDPGVYRRLPAFLSSWLLLAMSISAIVRLVWSAFTSGTTSEAILMATGAFFCVAFMKEAYDQVLGIEPQTTVVPTEDS
jgi:hypothetical protein